VSISDGEFVVVVRPSHVGPVHFKVSCCFLQLIVSMVHVVDCCGVYYRSVLFRVLDIGGNGSCMSSC
jgi:hypothetical protein